MTSDEEMDISSWSENRLSHFRQRFAGMNSAYWLQFYDKDY